MCACLYTFVYPDQIEYWQSWSSLISCTVCTILVLKQLWNGWGGGEMIIVCFEPLLFWSWCGSFLCKIMSRSFLGLRASWHFYDFHLYTTDGVWKSKSKITDWLAKGNFCSFVVRRIVRYITATISTYIFEQQAHRCTLESGVLHLSSPPSHKRYKTTYPLFLRETCFQTQHESRTDLE